MKKLLKRTLIIFTILVLVLGLVFAINYKNLTMDVYSHSKDIITFNDEKYIKLSNEKISYLALNVDDFEVIGFLNRNNFLKDNIAIYSINDNIMYIDPFQEYYDIDKIYLYSGLYIKEKYYDDFLIGFDESMYYKDISIGNDLAPTIKQFTENESKIIEDIILNKSNLEKFDSVKHDLSEYAYEVDIPHKNYKDIYFKIKFFKTKNNDIVIKNGNDIYFANEFKANQDINQNTSYYMYRGDDYSYLYNDILSDEDLIEFAFHDFIIESMEKDVYQNYVKDVFNVLENESYSLDNKLSYIRQLLYSKYRPTLREEFSLKIERLKNLNIINDNRKTYRIDNDFLFRLFGYPADLYAISFYEDDLLYNIPERYKRVYETVVHSIIDGDLDDILKNDLLIEIQNELVVVDEKQLQEMQSKYGEIRIIEESNNRIKYAPGYYGFLFDKIENIDDLKAFALHFEVLDNIKGEFFKKEYTSKINEILNSEKKLDEKLKEVVINQLKFSLIPLEKLSYYREKYKDNYYNESYINKIKNIIGS